MSDVPRLRYLFPKLGNLAYRGLMRTIQGALGISNDQEANFRLHCIQVFENQGWMSFHQSFPVVSRASIYRWRHRYLQSHKKLISLKPQSTRPHKTRRMTTPSGVFAFLKAAREQYPRMGKNKLKILLDEYCGKQGISTIASSTIGKLIHRHSWFFQINKPFKTKRIRDKPYVHRCPRREDISLGYLQVDGVKIWCVDRYLYFLTAVEIKSRQAFSLQVKSFNSHQARDFLIKIILSLEYQIHTIQTDNGSEFAGLFHLAIIEAKLTHLFSRPRTPKSNGYVERFNYTIQDEFLNWQLDRVYDNTLEQALEDWLIFYNYRRPHQALNYLTPMQYLKQLQSSSNSSACLKCM